MEDKACKATGHRQAIECHLSGAPAAGVTVHLAAPPDDRSLSLGDTPEEVEKAFVVVNKLRRKWHSFARMTAPPSPPETALGAAEAKAEALLEEEAEWEASEEEEEKEGKLSDEAGLVGGLRRALQVLTRCISPSVHDLPCSRCRAQQARRPLALVRYRATPPPAADTAAAAAAQTTAAPASSGGTADALFRVMHTHQRCAAPVADSATGVFLFEAGCAVSGLAAAALIAVRKRRAALALAARAGLPRPPGMSCL